MSVFNPQSADAGNQIIDISNTLAVERFVDHFFIDHGLSSAASRIRIVKLLKFLPESITSQKEITSWIRKNWDKKFHGM
ncbi:MAG: hypothetical protein V4581_01935 [Bacteroidota bacterium]